jgi:ClpP class serine protease
MGIYSEYLDKGLGGDIEALNKERKVQLERISRRRGRDVLVFAADLKPVINQERALLRHVTQADILPITDQLTNLSGSGLDLILETAGGFAEIAEQLLRILRSKYSDFAVIVPGAAKGAGSILAMGADEILMEPFASALGPIDAQLRGLSVEALLTGVEKIKKEVVKTEQLNKAYVPLLQGVSPGDLQNARYLLDLSKNLVTEWLANYKFKTWTTHRTPGKPTYRQPVTEVDKKRRGRQIARQLANHKAWKAHSRSITLEDLRAMRLEVTDYAGDAELADAVRRYYTLLQMTFETNIYKVYETPGSQILRYEVPLAAQKPLPAKPTEADVAIRELVCKKCQQQTLIQANLRPGLPLQAEHTIFPATNRFICPGCGTEQDLSQLRQQIELVTKKKIIP